MNGWLLRLAAYSARVLPGSLKRVLYRLGPITTWLRGLLSRAAPDGLSEVIVAGGALAGKRLQLNLQTEKDLWLGTYEPELQAALRSIAKERMTAYDVGANIGYITLLLMDLLGPEGRVFAFEPHPANLERLKTHLELNPGGSRVVVVPAAVGKEMGRAEFLIHPSASRGKLRGSEGRRATYSHPIEVEVLDLDSFVFTGGRPAPDLVKIDIEGGEANALAGMRRLMKQGRPVVVLELHGPEAAQAVWRELTEAGYRVYLIRRGYPEVRRVEALDWKAYLLARPPDDVGVQNREGVAH